MFVAEGAKKVIVKKRRKQFIEQYITKLFNEAKKLSITKEELLKLIKEYKGGDN